MTLSKEQQCQRSKNRWWHTSPEKPHLANHRRSGIPLPNFELYRLPNAFSPEKETLTLDQARSKRRQELIFTITKSLIEHQYTDDDGNPKFYQFKQLKSIVEQWLNTKVKLIGDAFENMLFYYEPKTICQHIMLGIHSEQRKTDIILPVFNYYNKFGSTMHVRGQTTRNTYPTKHSHVNVVVADTESWEQIAAKTFDELHPRVLSYVKNAYLDFKIPYCKDGKDNPMYEPDFIARGKSGSGKTISLIIEITGMNKDKAEKKWYVENRWLPAVNAVREKYGYDEWYFTEIAGDIRDIKNQIKAKLAEIR